MNKCYLSGADGIRGIAVIIVLFVHAVTMFFPATFPLLLGVGKIGVWLFFVLSAFLLAKKFIKKNINTNELIVYFVGRFLRIIPLFTIALFIYCWAGYYSFDKLLNQLTFQWSFAHLWTIPVEFKFYFILPFFTMLMCAIHRRYGTQWLLIASLAIISIHQLIFPFWKLKGNSIEMLWYIPSFLVGIITSILHENKLKISSRLSLFIVPAMGLFITLSAPGSLHAIFGTEITDYLLKQHIPFSILWCVIILSLIDGHGFWGKIVSSRILRNLGAWSFSVYLFHYIIFLNVAARFTNNFAAMAISFLSSILIGALSYYLIEKKIEQLRYFITKKIRTEIAH